MPHDGGAAKDPVSLEERWPMPLANLGNASDLEAELARAICDAVIVGGGAEPVLRRSDFDRSSRGSSKADARFALSW